MWTTVYVAIGLDMASEIQQKLKAEGFLIKIRYFTKEGEDELYEILAPEFEIKDIEQAMIELGLM